MVVAVAGLSNGTTSAIATHLRHRCHHHKQPFRLRPPPPRFTLIAQHQPTPLPPPQVSKAMNDKAGALAAGDAATAAFHAKRVELFTEQLVESNPILVRCSSQAHGTRV